MSCAPLTRQLVAQSPLRATSLRGFASSARRDATFGFVGLGRMGYPMAKNLRAKIPKGDTLIVFDVVESACKRFEEEVASEYRNTRIAKEVKDVAAEADTMITSLPEPSHVRSVFDAVLAAGIKSSSDPPKLYIDCSTIDPITSREVARNISSAGAGAFIDAPMSGGVIGAEAGTLTFMLGCPEGLLDRAKATLELMGKRIVHLGDQGAGLCGKLANNYALAINNIAIAEAMSMGIQWGLDPKALAGMINTSTGKSWPSEVNNPVPGVLEKCPANRGYEGGFGVSLMAKDLRLAMESAKEFGVRNELGEKAMEVYNAASADERCKGKDFSSVYVWLDGPAAKA